MHRSFYILFLTLILLFTLIIENSCKKESDDIFMKKVKISGFVQKGPFVNGTSVNMFELDDSLDQTGKVFNTQITNNNGSFEINNIALTSQFVEFSADGYYFNEITGEISPSQLTLSAVSDISEISTININILTHLEKNRVDYLVRTGKTFSEAKESAQREVLEIFGFQVSDIENSELLNITINTDENALLLATSIVLQGNRSVGDLTELLANIINDIQQDGEVNDPDLISTIRSNTTSLDLTTIRSNLEKRYQELGLNATIPDFEKYVIDYWSFTGLEPTSSTEGATEITTSGAILNGIVNANDLNTTVTFEYGTSTLYGSSITALQSPLTGHNDELINAVLTGLNPGTLYHYRVKSVNSQGTSFGSDTTFTTLGQVPSANSLEPSNVMTTSATLNGEVNANYLETSVVFEYGLTIHYGQSILAIQNPITGNTISNVSAELTGLMEDTTYYYRVRATNLLGASYSNGILFNTLGQKPAVHILEPTNVSFTSATLNGSVTSNISLTTVTFEYGLTTNYGQSIAAIQSPIEANSISNVSATITGLSENTTYHYRIKAVNSKGTSYSNDMEFATIKNFTFGEVKDIEGNNYKTVEIGNQVWMCDNLRTVTYNNGSPIPQVKEKTTWENLEGPGYCWYENDELTYKSTYGALYNWYVVNTGLLCPAGWHVPDDDEWHQMVYYLDRSAVLLLDESYIAGALLSEMGFTLYPGGWRENGLFALLGPYSCIWSSSEAPPDNAYLRQLSNPGIVRDQNSKKTGCSVRCIKD